LLPDRGVRITPGGRTHAKSEDHRGRYVRPTLVRPNSPDLALDATLRAAAPFQQGRERGNLALAIADPDLRFKVRERRIGRHLLFVVDASGSMGADERMAETKAAILSLLLDAYQHRERVGLIVFRGESARLALPFTGSVEAARRYLTQLPTGGKTPLPHGLHLAMEVIGQEKARYPKDAFLMVLITDGKANITLSGRPPMEEVKALAARIGGLGINTLVLNTERYWHEPSCLPEISRMLGGSYHTLSTIRAHIIVSHIGQAWG
jgi:magnesium chelatase subunit D